MNQLATLAFYAKYNGWHSYNSRAKRSVMALVRKGFLVVNEYGQAKFTGKASAH